MAKLTEKLKILLTRSPRLYDLARRPYALLRFLLRRPHDPDYAAFGLFDGPDGLFLDIGANAGMSIYSFRIYRRRGDIMSIEPNPFHARDLKFVTRIVRGASYRIAAVGSQPGRMTLYIPIYRGVPLTTEASLSEQAVRDSPHLRERLGDGMDGSEFRVVRREVPVITIDDLGVDPTFVKVDVQGFEHQVLLGMKETLARCKPVLMLETPPEASYELLESQGYESRVFDHQRNALVRPEGEAVNVFFVPREQAA